MKTNTQSLNIYLFFVGVLFLQLGHAQSSLEGKVIDNQHNPIPEVYILNLTSGAHAHANALGNFTIEDTKEDDIIQVGGLGFKQVNKTLVAADFNQRIVITLEDDIFQLSEVVIQPKVNALKIVADIDLKTNPVETSQELLQKVPGLIIGQHAGGGKAEQIFLRGFDVDHGTDVAISVDGMPVNMVSHAHGQGYADLHFVIPETLDNIDFGKGPYYASKGNFATAAYVDFKTKDALTNSQIQLQAGDFNYKRALGMFNLLNTPTSKAYIASAMTIFDGPFDSPQNFSRFNLFGKYTALLKGGSSIAVSASHFGSTWDASGQIPVRAVESGLISRFGAIDDTEGGTTHRSNLNVIYKKILDDHSYITANAFYNTYEFELYSNFTFFLDDPENGDQIKQKEKRDILGFNTEYNKQAVAGDFDVLWQVGAGFRADNVNGNELSHTLNRREVITPIQYGDVRETNFYGYLNAEFTYNKWVLNPAVRIDNFRFSYADLLSETYTSQSQDKSIISPKLNILFNESEDLQFYFKSGLGFHSNDTRVVVAQEGHKILPAAYGTDLGTIWRPSANVIINAAAWYLFLEQEFVYVGDAGIVEPSGKTERYGVDLGIRYQLTDWLFFNTDATYTVARSIEELDGEDYIPLAPDFTMTGGLGVTNLGRLSGGIQYRYIDDRPANEDNSIIAEGYFVLDANVNYTLSKNLSLGVSVQNITDTEWNETQFATTSRLQGEVAPVEEIHFTPGTPFFIKGNIAYKF